MSDNVINKRNPPSAVKGSYGKANGVNLYYEVHNDGGVGRPLMLLHGGLGDSTMFAPLLPALPQTHQTITVELQGHGHTADIDRPFSFEAMADDVAALIQELQLGTVDLLGYSLGGGVALQTAIRHPEVVNRLILVSAPGKRDGWYPEQLAGMGAMNAEVAKSWIGSPMQQAYASVAPRPEDWPALVDKTGQLLKQDYDWSDQVKALKMPVLIAVGDADGVQTAHAVELFGLLGGGKTPAGWDGSGMPNARLAILPATTHYDILYSPILAMAINAFIETPRPEPK